MAQAQRHATNMPDAFVCCISDDVMKDPVTAADKHTYERRSIEEWLRTHSTSPWTGEVLASKELVPNMALRDAITDWQTTKFTRIPQAQLAVGALIGAGSFKRVHRGIYGGQVRVYVAYRAVYVGREDTAQRGARRHQG